MPCNGFCFFGDPKEIKGTNTEVTYEIEEITSDVTYSVKVVDESGNVQKDGSGNELKKDGGKIICSDGFFKRLIAFFRAIFKIFPWLKSNRKGFWIGYSVQIQIFFKKVLAIF